MATLGSRTPVALAPSADPPLDVPAAVHTALAGFLATEAAALTAMDTDLEPLARVAARAVLDGGKRIRPTFAYWGWRGLRGPDAAVTDVLPALAALELLHAFALVHDDVMDASLTRRGGPTAHRALADLHVARARFGSPARFGVSAAILVGDLCLVWADQLIAGAALPAAVTLAARRVYDRMRVEAIAGQYLDVWGEAAPTWSVDRALATARLKTASYTVTRPLLYGAALGGEPEETSVRHLAVTRAYARYGQTVGVAFQLRDDLLGLYGEAHVTGKPVGDDLATAKPTVLLQLARDLATPRQAGQLERALRRRRAPDVARVAELVAETGAKSKVETMMGVRVAAGHDALAGAPIDDQARDALDEMADAAIWRTS